MTNEQDQLIIEWQEEIENIFQTFGPYTALEALNDPKFFPNLDAPLPEQYLFIKKASIEFRDNQFNNAIESLDRVEHLLPDTMKENVEEWYYIKASCLNLKKEYSAGLSVANKGLESFPDHLKLLSTKFQSEGYLGTKSYEENYNAATKKYGEALDLMGPYSQYLFRNDFDDQAAEIAEEILKIDPNNVSALDIVGTVAFVNEDDEKALSSYVLSSELWPYNLARLQTLVDITMVMGDPENIYKAFNYGLRYFPKDYEINEKYASYLLHDQAKDPIEIISLIEPLLDHVPDNIVVRIYLVNALVLAQNWEQAKHHIDNCAQQHQYEDIIYSLKERIEAGLKS